MSKLEGRQDIYDTVAKSVLKQPQESRREILDKIHLELEFRKVMQRIYKNIVKDGEESFKMQEGKHVRK